MWLLLLLLLRARLGLLPACLAGRGLTGGSALALVPHRARVQQASTQLRLPPHPPPLPPPCPPPWISPPSPPPALPIPPHPPHLLSCPGPPSCRVP
ncbi:hypothetical protein V8C86DRAFT_2562843, partial [Haematococcus lacustris]